MDRWKARRIVLVMTGVSTKIAITKRDKKIPFPRKHLVGINTQVILFYYCWPSMSTRPSFDLMGWKLIAIFIQYWSFARNLSVMRVIHKTLFSIKTICCISVLMLRWTQFLWYHQTSFDIYLSTSEDSNVTTPLLFPQYVEDFVPEPKYSTVSI